MSDVSRLSWCRTKWRDDTAMVIVLRPETVEHWLPRMQVFGCETWGQVRKLPADVYAEVLGLAGYGEFEDFAAHLQVSGAVPLPGVEDLARGDFIDRQGRDLPQDTDPFSTEMLPACADGDWPPEPLLLMGQEVPDEIIDRFGERMMTTFNGEYVWVRAAEQEAALQRLSELGYSLTEDPRIEELILR